MAQLEFDESLVNDLEVLYRRRDILRRRRLVHEVLDARPGERVLDVGCGPGFFATELLERVGPAGSVTGIDSSAAMLGVAVRRTEQHENVAFHQANATELPVADGTFDAALSVQVLEYVPDVAAAIAEIYRALRPGGRVVIWDVDWSTVSWQSRDQERMRRMLDAWDTHLTHPALPRTLASQLRRAGFENVEIAGHAFVTTAWDPETYGGALVDQIVRHATEKGGIAADDAGAWKVEQQQLDAAGEFYFACTQCCFRADKPG